MEVKDEIKLIRQIYRRMQWNMFIRFLKDYVRSIPVFIFFSAIFITFGFVFRDFYFVTSTIETVDFLSLNKNLLRYLGVLLILIFITISLAPWNFIKYHDSATRDFLFISPIKRETIVLNKVISLYTGFIIMTPLIILFLFISLTRTFGVQIDFFRWLLIICFSLIIIITFGNIGFIWSIESEKLPAKKRKIIEYSLYLTIFLLIFYFISRLYINADNRMDIEESITSILGSPPFNIFLVIPNMVMDIILAESLNAIVLVEAGILLTLFIISIWYVTKLDLFVYEDHSMPVIKQLKKWAMRYGAGAGYGGTAFLQGEYVQEIKMEEPWWRIGPLKKLRWHLPNTGLNRWAIFAKDLLLTNRYSSFMFIQIFSYGLFLFMFSLIAIDNVIVTIILIFLIIITIGLMNLNFNLLKEREHLSIIRMLPISSNKIISVSILSTVLIPLVIYFSYASYFFLVSDLFYFEELYFSYICGPILIVLCAVIIHLSYFLLIKFYDFKKPGGDFKGWILGFIFIFIIFLLNIILGYALWAEVNNIIVSFLILTVLNLFLLMIFYKATIILYERSDIRGY